MADGKPGLVIELGIDDKELVAGEKKALASTDAFVAANEQKHKGSLSRVEQMYAKLQLKSQLNIATAGGDDARIRQLQDELALNAKIAELKRTRRPDGTVLNNDSARAQAQEYMANLQAARAAKEAADAAAAQRQTALAAEARAFQVEQLALQERLQVAQAIGDKAQITALEEELVLTQTIARYRALGFSAEGAEMQAKAFVSALAEADAARIASGTLSRTELMELGHVARSAFDSLASGASPMRVLEQEGARVAQALGETPGGAGAALRGLMGAISPMTAGLIAGAAALATTAVVIGKVREAAESVENLKMASIKVGVPTAELQEWQFVAAASHVSNEQLDESFRGLSETLGKLKSGIREARVKPFLEELGLSDADIAKTKDAADFLDLIQSKMANITDPSERIQIAQAFGMSQALPILAKTKDEIDSLKESFRQAGVTISDELVDKIVAQNDALDQAHALMHDRIQADLVQLAPLIKQLGLEWDHVADAALQAAIHMAQAAASKPPKPNLVDAALDTLGRVAPEMGGMTAGMRALYDGAQPSAVSSPSPGRGSHASSAAPPTGEQTKEADAAAEENRKVIDRLNHVANQTAAMAEIQKDNAALTGAGRAPLSADDINRRLEQARTEDAKSSVAAGKKGMELDQTSTQDVFEARKAYLKALVAVTGDLQQDHAEKLDELKNERDQKNAKANGDFKKGDITAGARDQIVGFNNQAYDAGVQKENRDYTELVAEHTRAYATDLLKYQVAHLSAQAQIATTAEAWAKDEMDAFAIQQDMDRQAFVVKTHKRVTSAGGDHLDAAEAQAEIGQFDADQAEANSAKTRAVNLEVLSKRQAFANELDGFQTATLQAEAGIATTAAARRDIELQILAMRQQAAKDALELEIQKDNRSPEQATQLRQGLANQQGAETAAFNKQNQGPLANYASGLGDINTQVQTDLVSGLQGLNSGLATAIVHSKDLGQAFHEAALGMVEDLIKIGLQQAEVGLLNGAGIGVAPTAGVGTAGAGAAVGGGLLGGLLAGLGGGGGAAPSPGFTPGGLNLEPQADPLNAALTGAGMNPQAPGAPGLIGSGIASAGMFAKMFGLFGFQDGTNDAPGGPALVGEGGPEIVDLPAGAQVKTNSQLSALGSMRPNDVRQPAPSPLAYFDLRGAVMTQDLLRQANAQANAYAQTHAAQAFSMARQVIPNDLAQRQRGQLGR